MPTILERPALHDHAAASPSAFASATRGHASCAAAVAQPGAGRRRGARCTDCGAGTKEFFQGHGMAPGKTCHQYDAHFSSHASGTFLPAILTNGGNHECMFALRYCIFMRRSERRKGGCALLVHAMAGVADGSDCTIAATIWRLPLPALPERSRACRQLRCR